MIHASASSDIERPAAEVFDFVAEMTNNPRWQRGMRSCRWTSEPPLRVGSTYEQVARFLGKEVVTSFRVNGHEAGRAVTIASTAGSFPITVTRTVEPLGAGRCRAREVVDGDPRGFYRIAAPILRRVVERSMRADHGRLKGLLERG